MPASDPLADDAAAPPSAPLVTVGEVVGPFGHRGEIKVYPYTDFPERLVDLQVAVLRDPRGGPDRRYPVLRARLHKNIAVMQLEGVSTMDDAEALRGRHLVVPPAERYPLPGGTFYVDDLIGLRVRTEAGREVGTIRQVLKGPANDVYDLGDHLIPAVREVVRRVDLDEGVMVIHPIPGLLDEPEVA